MPDPPRAALIALSIVFLAIGAYHRIQSQRSGESLDRRHEGWPILIGIRLTGLLLAASSAAWLYNPRAFQSLQLPIPRIVQWIGVAGFALSVLWLLWMFRTLGRNLTDTVVTRRDATLVTHGPYRYVRNPMYLGVLTTSLSVALVSGIVFIPVLAILMFTLFAIRTRTEERFLIARFGQRYVDYMACTGRFFPFQHPPRRSATL